MSSISSGFNIIFGILEWGVLRNTRSEYSVIEGAAATAENFGAAGFAEDWLGFTAWHSEHQLSDSASPLEVAAHALPATASTLQRMINALEQLLFLMLTVASRRLVGDHIISAGYADDFTSGRAAVPRSTSKWLGAALILINVSTKQGRKLASTKRG